MFVLYASNYGCMVLTKQLAGPGSTAPLCFLLNQSNVHAQSAAGKSTRNFASFFFAGIFGLQRFEWWSHLCKLLNAVHA